MGEFIKQYLKIKLKVKAAHEAFIIKLDNNNDKQVMQKENETKISKKPMLFY